MITGDQLFLHALGDYALQSDSMALQKRSDFVWATYHAFVYSIPFLLVTHSAAAWFAIFWTHAVIDHWGLARYVCWAKNWLFGSTPPWSECSATGYPADRPAWMAVWLMIAVDNLMHIAINAAAIKWL